jgi:hypothetical protein
MVVTRDWFAGTESGLRRVSPLQLHGPATALQRKRRIVSEQHFTPDMTVDQAFRLHAGARRVFAGFHLGGCSNCAISETHTIGAISDDYGIPLPMLLESLNALFDGGTLAVGDRVRIPDEIRAKIPQLANVPEIGQITGADAGAYTAEFGEVRLQGLAEDFLPAEAGATV